MIVMPNIDQHIWNIEFLIADVIKEFNTNGSVDIDLNNEGPDASELGLYNLLDYVCNKYAIDKRLITIYTRNLIEQHPDYRIVISDPLYVKEVQHFAQHNDFTHKNFERIKHFGLFIGRSNWQRLWVSAEMFGHYTDQTLQTFLYESTSDYHKEHLGFDKLVHQLHGDCDFKSIMQLIAAAPVRLENINEFPILTPAHFNIAKHYDKFLIELVCETYTAGRSFYPTEKTWRPIVCKTPFILQGPVDFLKNLRRLGFQTFSQYWDESYDEDGQILGTKAILNNIKRLSAMSTNELQCMYNSMQPILDHNYDVMMNLNFDSFK